MVSKLAMLLLQSMKQGVCSAVKANHSTAHTRDTPHTARAVHAAHTLHVPTYSYTHTLTVEQHTHTPHTHRSTTAHTNSDGVLQVLEKGIAVLVVAHSSTPATIRTARSSSMEHSAHLQQHTYSCTHRALRTTRNTHSIHM
jgi:hypothetical protein